MKQRQVKIKLHYFILFKKLFEINNQMFLDDVGVTVTMISVTLLAVIVVLLKIFIFSEQVKIIQYRSQKRNY